MLYFNIQLFQIFMIDKEALSKQSHVIVINDNIYFNLFLNFHVNQKLLLFRHPLPSLVVVIYSKMFHYSVTINTRDLIQ